MSKNIVVSGYATTDYILNLKAPFNGRNVAHIQPIENETWARPGGATLYASIQLAESGSNAYPLVWLGDDSSGSAYLEACKLHGLKTDAINILAGQSTPSCFLIYQEDGSQGCLLDNGRQDNSNRLTCSQVELIAKADVVCITAGPANQTKSLLEHVNKDCLLVWIAKQDETCFPDDVQRLIARKVDIVFCNESERQFVNRAIRSEKRSNVKIVETRGDRGVILVENNQETLLEINPVASDDTTGAGDTFAGAMIGALLSNKVNFTEAAKCGIDAAGDLLKSRL